MPFVREADRAIRIGPPPARESYLDGAKILAAAQEAGAQAIHPGYGFLSENADFAEAVEKAGLIWVGAPPAAIRAMGLKDAAKKLMQAAGVPVTPGLSGRRSVAGAAEAGSRAHRLSGADQGGGGRRRQGHAPGRGSRRVRGGAGIVPARGRGRLRRRPRAAGEICRPARAISKCRYSATVTAMSCICSSAIVPCSAATRK